MEQKAQIGQLFDGIAGSYDRFNHLLSLNIDRSWRRKAVRDLKVRHVLALDVAIGTADLTLELLRQKVAERVVGIDLSREMMRVGEQKVEKAALGDKVQFDFGSALEMPYSDCSFDVVTCAFGVRNFSNLDKGLSEMYRVMKPGGSLLILEFSYPSNRLVRSVYDVFFTNVMPAVGKLVSKKEAPYNYFRDSVKNFIWGEQMLSRIVAAGFRNARFKSLSLGIATMYRAEK